MKSSYAGDIGSGGLLGNCKSTDATMGGYVIDNLFDGKLIFPNANCTGGLIGWSGATLLVDDNIYMGSAELHDDDRCATIGRGSAYTTTTGNYYVNSLYGKTESFAIQVTPEQMADGSLCFKLNGDQSDIRWYQNLTGDADAYPVPYANGHARVYTDGELSCNGKMLTEDPLYTNDVLPFTIPEHSFKDHFCEKCMEREPGYKLQCGEDGFYVIRSSGDMALYMLSLKEDNIHNSARLEADVDLAPYKSLGICAGQFAGTFDGQGHKLNVDIQGALFGSVPENGVDQMDIRNVVITGKGIVNVGWGGFLLNDVFGTMTNVISVADIEFTTPDGSAGGLAGWGDCAFYNCMQAGRVHGTIGGWNGGFMGWTNRACYYENCAMIAPLESEGSEIWYRGAQDRGMVNCYCANFYVNSWSSRSATVINTDQISNGYLTYNLNKGSVENPIYYQTLGVDSLPTQDPTHGVVYQKADGTFGDIHDEASYKEYISVFVNDQKAWADGLHATVSQKDAYKAQLDGLLNMKSLAEYLAAKPAIDEAKKALEDCAAAYKTLDDTKTLYLGYLNEQPEKTSETRTELRDFLEADEEPDPEGFIYGSVPYIYNNCLATAEEVRAAITYIETLWGKIRMEDFEPGTDITDMLRNADFSNGVEGWEGDPKASPWGFSYPNVVESWCFNSHTYQVLTDLTNGVYMVSINGMFRSGGNNEARFYTSYLYANDQLVPLQFLQEDLLPKDQAVDYQNCLISQDQEKDGCYYANSSEGMHYAVMGGRYQNHILVNVTDGKLELGVKALGTGLDYDWTIFGNAKLTYCGEVSKADAQLQQVLAGQVARANTILNTEISFGADYANFPNFSAELRAQLLKAIEDAVAADTPEKKYEMINTFSQLFPAIYDCQKAYIRLMGEYEMNYSLVAAAQKFLSEERSAELNEILSKAINEGYIEGKFSAEEANNWKMSLFPAGISEDGYYLLSDKSDYAMFAALTNIMNGISGRLVADLDGLENEMVIQNMQGVLDGGYHTITVNLSGAGAVAPIINLQGTVKNLIVKGNIDSQSETYVSGLVSKATNALIENCEVYVNINASSSTPDTYIYSGGLCANVDGTTINNCLYGGNINGGDNIAACGSLVGSAGGTMSSIKNSLFTGEMHVANLGSYGISRDPSKVSITNTYYKQLYGERNQGSSKMTAEQLASGEACYRLNNGDRINPVWFQTLGVDATPTIKPTGAVVYKRGQSYSNELPVRGDEKLITDASQFSSNSSDCEEGTNMNYLIDGDNSTIWHSDWHGQCGDQYHYLQVALNREFDGDITLEMVRRGNNGNNHPTKMIVSGSKDGVEFTDIATLDLPFEGTGTTVSAMFYSEGFSYLRFTTIEVNSNFQKFWHAAEFQLYGNDYTGVKSVSVEKTATKGIYNLQGQRLNKMQKGLNIVDGKKILVK